MVGSVSLLRDEAFRRNSLEPRSMRCFARRSAAELLGAHARILARRLDERIWRMASMAVTVFPVPGLRADGNS